MSTKPGVTIAPAAEISRRPVPAMRCPLQRSCRSPPPHRRCAPARRCRRSRARRESPDHVPCFPPEIRPHVPLTCGKRTANQFARQRAGVFVVRQQHLSTDDRSPTCRRPSASDALHRRVSRARHRACAARPSRDRTPRDRPRARRAADHDRAGPTAVAVSYVIRRTASSSVNACFSRTQCDEQMRLQRTVHDLRHVRARIGERHHRARMLHHLEHVVLVFVRDRLAEEHLEVVLERDVDHRLDRMHAALRARHRTSTACIVRHRVHQIDPVPIRRTRLGADDARTFVRRLRDVDERALDRRIAQLRLLLLRAAGSGCPSTRPTCRTACCLRTTTARSRRASAPEWPCGRRQRRFRSARS